MNTVDDPTEEAMRKLRRTLASLDQSRAELRDSLARMRQIRAELAGRTPEPVPSFWCERCDQEVQPTITGRVIMSHGEYRHSVCPDCGGEAPECDVCSVCSSKWDEVHDCCPTCGAREEVS